MYKPSLEDCIVENHDNDHHYFKRPEKLTYVDNDDEYFG